MDTLKAQLEARPPAAVSIRPARIFALDMIKCWAILLMFISHILILYGSPWLESTTFFKWFIYVNEGVGAPVFVFAMGLSVVLSNKRSPKQILIRSGILFMQGYLLNFLKFFFPVAVFHSFPSGLFGLLGMNDDVSGLFHLLLMGDILQFAAIAYALVGLLYHYSKHYHLVALVLVIAGIIISPLLYDGASPSNYVGGLLYGKAPLMFFPLLPWAIFPLLGLYVGYCITRNDWTINRVMAIALTIGLLAISAGLLLIQTNAAQWGSDYYHRGTGGLLLFTGMTLSWTALWHFATPIVPNSIQKAIGLCSKHVTLIYFIQWVLLYWGVGVVGFKTQNVGGYVLCLLGSLCFVLLLTVVWAKWKRFREAIVEKR